MFFLENYKIDLFFQSSERKVFRDIQLYNNSILSINNKKKY